MADRAANPLDPPWARADIVPERFKQLFERPLALYHETEVVQVVEVLVEIDLFPCVIFQMHDAVLEVRDHQFNRGQSACLANEFLDSYW